MFGEKKRIATCFLVLFSQITSTNNASVFFFLSFDDFLDEMLGGIW